MLINITHICNACANRQKTVRVPKVCINCSWSNKTKSMSNYKPATDEYKECDEC